LARYHQEVGDPINHDELPNRRQLEEMFDRGKFARFDLTDTEDLYLAIGFKE
jgi:hypothetical protein